MVGTGNMIYIIFNPPTTYPVNGMPNGFTTTREYMWLVRAICIINVFGQGQNTASWLKWYISEVYSYPLVVSCHMLIDRD